MGVLAENIQFDKWGRMMYHPDYHPNHGKPFIESDLEYLCKYWEYDHRRTMSFALGRPEHSLASMVAKLRKEGLFEYYKNLNKYW
ncbi:DNA-entry nuclease [Bacillus smithii]|uniref:DNA-entry nuclease n=1 Tax=Bacillus smithii TaxID=1479 RepID=UPI0030C91252